MTGVIMTISEAFLALIKQEKTKLLRCRVLTSQQLYNYLHGTFPCGQLLLDVLVAVGKQKRDAFFASIS